VVADPNVFIQESKVLTCDVRPGRRPRGPALLEYVADYRRRAGITTETGTRIATADGHVERAHIESDRPEEPS
jgi:formate dehydrogenase major subunit